MCKEERRKAIENLIENVNIVTFIQKQPYTVVQAMFPDINRIFTAFAKCVYPDVWSEERGKELCLERCAAEAYRHKTRETRIN